MRVPLVAGFGAGSFELETNFIRYLDVLIFGEAHLYGGMGLPFDPEGMLSTLPAAVTTMSGFFLGEYLRKDIPHSEKLVNLTVVGIIILFAGQLLSVAEPINKQLWTTSYVVAMAGMAILVWVFSSWLIDVKGWKAWAKPAIVFGSNPLIVFVGSGILGRFMYMIKWKNDVGDWVTIKGAIYNGLMVPLFGNLNGSLAYAITFILFWLVILWVLYEKKIFWKI
jgi:predicted acyltransferase